MSEGSPLSGRTARLDLALICILTFLSSFLPDVFTSTQLYALILLENAGTDLEAYKLKTWREAASVFAQAADALGRAERACGFEVRLLFNGLFVLLEIKLC